MSNILWTTTLNFHPDHLITSCYVIQNLLYWNDDINPPRKINIDKAIRFTNSGGADILGYHIISEQIIDRIKWPPKFSPLCSYQNDYSYNYNNLRGSTFQFAYSYIYDDNEKSTFSPITKLPIPYNEEAINGDYINNIHFNNCIDIILNTGNENIKAINIYGRSNATDDTPITVSANYSNWYLIERIEKYDTQGNVLIPNNNPLYSYGFLNNKIKDIVTQADAIRLFDYVPIFSGASELIEKNRILDGDITEGYDNVDIDVNLTVRQESVNYNVNNYTILPINIVNSWYVPTPFAPAGLYTVNSLADFLFNHSWYLFDMPVIPLQAGDVLNVLIDFIVVADPIPGTVYILSRQVIISYTDTQNYPQGARDKIASVLSNDIPIIIVNNYPNGIYLVSAWLSPGGDSCKAIAITINGTHFADQTIFKSWKSGGYQEFGLVYYDRANRSGATNKSEDTVKYIRFITETSYAGVTSSEAIANVIDWEINHIPPIWATHYQWVCSKSTTIKEYIHYHVQRITVSGNKTRVMFNTALVNYQSLCYKSILQSWVWQKGDRLRFVLLYNNLAVGQWTWCNPSTMGYGTLLDYEIIGYDSGTGEFICEYFNPASIYSMLTHYVPVIEVYRPAKEIGERRFYEMGECFEIGDAGLPTRYHKKGFGLTAQDQTGILPAKGTFDAGDCYVKIRRTAESLLPTPTPNFQYFPCEEENLSDFYVSDSCDIGRVNIVDRNMKQRRLQANLRFGGKLLQDTQINDLSRFDVLNAEQLPDKFGAIEKIIEVGDVVKVIQHIKCSSIYVGLQKTAEADNTSNLYTISGVLGTIIIPVPNHGTMHPESVCRWDRSLYFYDLLNGEYIRDTVNGTFAISSYGAVNYFRIWKEQILNALKNRGKSRVISAFDKVTEQVIVSLEWSYPIGHSIPIPGLRKETIAFLENTDEVQTVYSNQWKTFYNFTPEYYGYTGTAFVAFQDGNLWLQHSNNIRCNFMGVKYPEKITFVINISPDTIKRFLAMAYDSNKRWGVESIRIPVNENYPQGQFSSIKDAKFVSKEGYFYAEFNKDINTPGFASQLEALINGRELRSQTCEITMSNIHDDEVELFEAYITLILSPKSGVQ